MKQIVSENQKISKIKSQSVEEIDLKLKKEERMTQVLKLELMQYQKKIKDEQFKKSLFSDKVNELLDQLKKKDKKLLAKDEVIAKMKAFAEKLSQKYKTENGELKKKLAEMQQQINLRQVGFSSGIVKRESIIAPLHPNANHKIISGKVNTGSKFFSSIQKANPQPDEASEIDLPQSYLLSPMRSKNKGETLFNSAMKKKNI